MLELGFLLLAVAQPPSQPPPPPAPITGITAKLGREDGKPELIATVTSDGKPVPNVGVTFSLVRSFGDLTLGQDTTLDDGTAAAPFPAGLGADAQGGWTFKVALTSPETLAGQAATLRVESLAAPSSAAVPSRRELWSRSAPWSVLITVLALAGSAWAVYGFAGYQLYLIRQGGKDA
ncbi:MAG TPA: hypothetical protein VFT46_02410 [Holophagaceae bacterium]|nr:hypothetical protein [Holophagaceae bacterium]